MEDALLDEGSLAGLPRVDGTPARARAPARLAPDAARDERDLLALPFDVYQRYRLVGDIVRQLSGGGRVRVLDVGGTTGVLRRFLPEHAVHLVDVQTSAEPGLVLGDGGRLPFRDRSIDLVVACDTLEHVPPARRAAFLSECTRVARRGVVVAGPYRAERVDEAEETLRAFLREKLGFEHRYLEEHRTHGLPVRAEVEALLEQRGFFVTSIGHGNVERWLALLCLSMYLDRDVHLRRVAAHAYRFYNAALYASDRMEPVYRHAVVGVAAGVPLPSAGELFGEPPVAPEGAIEPFVHLAAELIAFDREQDVYQAERRRLTEVVEGLGVDLDGHRDKVAVLEQDLGGHRERVRVLEQDLDGHREERDVLACDLAGHRRRVADLEADLAGHRASLTELEAARGADQAELERKRFHAEELSLELERVRSHASCVEAEAQRANALACSIEAERRREQSETADAVAALERDLGQHARALAELTADVESRRRHGAQLEAEVGRLDQLAREIHDRYVAERAENEALRAELRSRWRSFKRLVRLRKR